MRHKEAPTDRSSTQGQWGQPEDIMKVRGNQTFKMPEDSLAKIRKPSQEYCLVVSQLQKLTTGRNLSATSHKKGLVQ